MIDPLHPSIALRSPHRQPLALPGCEHYAGSVKFLTKAFELQDRSGLVFDVTADLEDGAGVGKEVAHAQSLAAVIAERHSAAPQHQRMGLRIHDLDSPHWRHDLEIVLPRCAPALSYITIPKARSLRDLELAVGAVGHLCRQAGLHQSLPVHVLIETPSALESVHSFAAHPAVEVLDFGLLDFISEHAGIIPDTAMRSPAQFEHALLVRAKTNIVAAAAAYGKIASHNICTDIESPEQVHRDAYQARHSFGFTRMWSIHPTQIEPIVRAMQPDFSSIEAASQVLLKARASAWEPIRHEGKLHDRASYRHFWTLLQQAKAHGAPLAPEVLAAFFQVPR